MDGHDPEDTRRIRQELLNAVSHELGTPLTPVLLHLRRMQKHLTTDSGPMGESINVVSRNVERLIERINNIIKVTQLDSERFAVHIKRQPLTPLVARVVKEYLPVAKANGVKLVFRSGTQAEVYADAERFSEAVANLLYNAIRFNNPGGRITVLLDDNTIFARMRVADDGVGFPPEQTHRLFKPFAQLDTGVPHAYQGSGLGLFITKGIIDLHGGEIHGHSEGPGRGATFTVKIHMAKGTVVPGIGMEDPEREVEFNRRILRMV